MRLSTSQIFYQAVTAMQSKQAELAKTQLQLATGERVQTPSDDPAAATRIIQMTQVIETTNQYQRNADFAQTRLSHEENTLTDIVDLLQRVRELSVRANSDSLSQLDRQAIEAEVQTSSEALFQLANSTDANDEYLFSGFKTDTEPFAGDGLGNFVYQGDQGQRSLQIGARRHISVGDTGDQIFMNLDDGLGGTTNIFEIFESFSTQLNANNPSDATLTALDSAIDSVSNTRSLIGARINTIESQKFSNDSFSLLVQENRSNLKDLDYAEAVSLFEQQLLALQASQQSFVKIQDLSLFNYI